MTTTATPIVTTDEEHRLALNRIRQLMEIPGIPSQSDELTSLAVAVQEFERQHYPIEPPDPVDAVEYEIDQQPATHKALVTIFGSETALAEFMNREQQLTQFLAAQITDLTGIPEETLMRPFRDPVTP